MNRRLRGSGAAVAAAFLVALLLPLPALAQESKDAGNDECEGLSLGRVACEVKEEATDFVAAPFKSAGESILNTLAAAVGDAAVTVIGKVVGFFHDTATVDVTQGWFMDRYNFMAGVGMLLLLPMLILATIRAVVRQDMKQLLRSVFVHLPVAVLGTFVAIWLTAQLLTFTDHLTVAVSSGIGGDVRGFFKGGGGSVTAALTGTALAANPMLLIVFAGLIIIAGLVLWLELLVRSAAIYICVMFLPLVFAALVWPATAKWCKRLAETLVALILSKFVIVAVISLATTAFTSSVGAPDTVGAGEALGRVVGGGALFLMAAFAPFALFKLIPLAEIGATNAIDGLSRQPMQSLAPGGRTHSAYDLVKGRIRGHGGTSVAAAAGGVSGGAAALATTVNRGATQQNQSHRTRLDPAATERPPSHTRSAPRTAPREQSDVGGHLRPPDVGKVSRKDGNRG